MLDTLLSGGFGAIFGGVTGLIGTFLNNKKELKLAELARDERRDERAHELTVNDQTHNAKMDLIEAEFDHEEELSADSTFRESFTIAAKDVDTTENHSWLIRFLFGTVEVLRRLVRVVASYGSMTILGFITYFVYNNLDGFLENLQAVSEGAKAFALMEYLVFTVCYIATTIVLWWFGVRNNSKQPQR